MSNRIDKKELVSATLVQRHLVIPSSLPRTELRGNGAACPERSRREAEWSRGISSPRKREIPRLVRLGGALARNDE